jgi:outer membrane usher protein
LLCVVVPARVWAESFEPLPLAVAINGNTVSDGTTVLRESGDTYAISLDDARSWRLVVPASAYVSYEGQTYAALRLLSGVVVVYDDASQSLYLTVPSRYFKVTRVDTGLLPAHRMPKQDRGAFLDYDVRAYGGSDQHAALSSIFDSGITVGDGVLNADFVGAVGADITSLRRISTTWQQDDPLRHTTLRIGDAAGDAAALLPPQPFLGVQLISNFSTAPGLQLNARPSVSGTLASPADADVYVDGKLVLQQILPTGPFQIDNVAANEGGGDLQVVVKDAAGHEQIITNSSYYTSSQVLRRGFARFSLGAGLEGFPTSTTEQYGRPIAEGFEERGLTDRFTGELNAQVASGGSSVSTGGLWLVPGLGTFDAALTAGAGAGSLFDYEYVHRRFSFGVGESSLQQNNPVIFTPGFQTPVVPLAVLRTAQFHLSFPTSARSSLALSMNEQSSPGITTRVLAANLFASVGRRAQMNFGLLKTTGSLKESSAVLQLSLPLDGRHNATIATGEQNAQAAAELSYSSQALFDGVQSRPGYSVSAGTSDLSAQISDTKSAMDVDAAFSESSGLDFYQFDAQGSIASVDHRVLAARSIQQAYGIAVVPGYPHVRVYVNNQFAGITDAHGEALLSNLQPYQENSVSLESKDLPITANIQTLRMMVVPSYHAPVIVRFPVRGSGGIIIHVKMPDGSYLPAGAVLTAADSSSWAVADQGEAYLDGVAVGSLSLTASGGGVHCAVKLTVPKDISDIPDIGEVVCH